MPEARKTLGPVVLLGLAAGGLAFAASVQGWAAPSKSAVGANPGWASTGEGLAEVPLAEALSLLVLASWGVVLVTRRWVRRIVALLGTAASVGYLATLIWAADYVIDQVQDRFVDPGGGVADAHYTGWYWAAWVSGLLSVLATAAAVRFARAWPEMGTRYDAPGAGETVPAPLEEQSNLEMWKSIDEGHDPTQ